MIREDTGGIGRSGRAQRSDFKERLLYAELLRNSGNDLKLIR